MKQIISSSSSAASPSTTNDTTSKRSNHMKKPSTPTNTSNTSHHNTSNHTSTSNNNNLMNRFLHHAEKTIHHITTKKYTLPDKIVASQILMYRQLLHTSCRNSLILSRPYENTTAQNSVFHMPWWETTTITKTIHVDENDHEIHINDDSGLSNSDFDVDNRYTSGGDTKDTSTSTSCDITTQQQQPVPSSSVPYKTKIITQTLTMKDTGKMIISYQNLIQRLWYHGLKPYYMNSNNTNTNDITNDTNNYSTNITNDTFFNTTTTDSCSSHTIPSISPSQQQHDTNNSNTIPTFTIPHSDWVHKLGFQQNDPITDFRSGGILSLALMVYIVESCPNTYYKFIKYNHHHNSNTTTTTTTTTSPTSPDIQHHQQQYHHHPVSVLPFGITCINITDMIAKILLLSKRVDHMDTLISQKPFWKMFHDPYAILYIQEIAIEILCIVVMEIVTIRQVEAEIKQQQCNKNNASIKNTNTSNSIQQDTTLIGTTITSSAAAACCLWSDTNNMNDDNNNNNDTNTAATTTTTPFDTINTATTSTTTIGSNNIQDSNTNNADHTYIDYNQYISVFDFNTILTITEERVEYDLLGSGPISIYDLKQNIYINTLIPKYNKALQNKINKLRNSNNSSNNYNGNPNEHNNNDSVQYNDTIQTPSTETVHQKQQQQLSESVVSSPLPNNDTNTTNHNKSIHENVLHHATHGIGNFWKSSTQTIFKLTNHNNNNNNANNNNNNTYANNNKSNATMSTTTPTVAVVDLLDNPNDDSITNDSSTSNTTYTSIFPINTPSITGMTPLTDFDSSNNTNNTNNNNNDTINNEMYDIFDSIDLNRNNHNQNDTINNNNTTGNTATTTTVDHLFSITDE